MEVTQYLILSKGVKRWKPSIKLVSSLKNTMPSNSVAVRLNLVLPDSIFDKPQLEATIKINDSDISKPIIKAETLDNIKQELNKNLGIDLSINIITQVD